MEALALFIYLCVYAHSSPLSMSSSTLGTQVSALR